MNNALTRASNQHMELTDGDIKKEKVDYMLPIIADGEADRWTIKWTS